jgi:hypothetical protein
MSLTRRPILTAPLSTSAFVAGLAIAPTAAQNARAQRTD